jgi:aldehyde:ferredoxin oxidoreductase
MDAISCGVSIAFAMECFENEILTVDDTGGLEFHWGDSALLNRAVEMTANREGFGDVLAEGVARMAARFGPESEPFNMTVKGQELPMHEPRLKAGLGAGYALAPVGADHMMNIHDTAFVRDGPYLQRVNSALDQPLGPVPREALSEDKLTIFFHEVNYEHFLDCALICHFYCYDYVHMAEALSGASGVEYSIQDILAVGARAQTLARLFNLREGITEQDDRLPARVMRAFAQGPIAGAGIAAEELDWFKRQFYARMKWDANTGEPSNECLRELGLDQLLRA